MDSEIKKFLEFNGKAVYFLARGGTYWIAIKPICEALQVNFSRQLRTLKADQILGQLWSLETIVGADGKLRKMAALPERFVYGWLFSIKSESKELLEYKRECYNLLFDYFHGSITSRETLIRAKTKEELEEERLEAMLATNEHYQQLQRIRYNKKLITKKLAALDGEIAKEQLNLFQ
jgi:hypothetical protein